MGSGLFGDEIVKIWNNGKTETHKGDPFNILKTWTKEYKSNRLKDLPSIGQFLWFLGVLN
ncbi:MAG: hypothetical protein Ct9H90mP6_12100 [Gammaproteobacteria bacterium]|nr:MAG: hypothetical protein Ct9H90mP6_12100 [Gammaproteobacteria bacterium]